MPNIETITIRRFPENPEIPDKICVEINEDEMMAWFLNHFENTLIKREKEFQNVAVQAKKFYQKEPKRKAFMSEEIGNIARDSFLKMLSAMKRIAKVRTLP